MNSSGEGDRFVFSMDKVKLRDKVSSKFCILHAQLEKASTADSASAYIHTITKPNIDSFHGRDVLWKFNCDIA